MTKKLWIVYEKDKIVGCFHSKKRATDFMMDLWFGFDGMGNVKIKEISLDEYRKMCYNQIKKER
jgi:hypothetical protein